MPDHRSPCALMLAAILGGCGGGSAGSTTFTATPTATSLTSAPQTSSPSPAPTGLRRPISPQSPLFYTVIDSWNAADPQKIIDLIPQDLRPYTVLLISLSIDHDGVKADGSCNFRQVEYGAETARSWLKVAAQNRMWVMLQPSSGGYSQLPDYDPGIDLHNTVYGEFFRDYPNFLGFNYAEQFWGFGGACGATSQQRWHHLANLLKLTNEYGGYLTVSFSGDQAGLNAVSMVKSDPTLETALRQYAGNFIMEEKYTSSTSFNDNESAILGMFLSGYTGNIGIRTDRTGWTDANGSKTNVVYPTAAGAPHLMEHLSFNGETVFDGPELTYIDEIHTLNNANTADGYSSRRFEFSPSYVNIHQDIYRRILDGTMPILSRQQVLARTKIAMVQDVTSGPPLNQYAPPGTLFSGLYLMDGDGMHIQQHSWYKNTGRYATIPTIWHMADGSAPPFPLTVNVSAYATHWPTLQAKIDEFNSYYPQEYTGNIYAGRHDNVWVTYNPYKTNQTASGTITPKYNSCAAIALTYAPFTAGVITESAGQLNFYLTNYDSTNASTAVDTIGLSGATTLPTFTFADTGNQAASSVTGAMSGTQYVLTVTHNGPLKITVNCSGNATDRLTSYPTVAAMTSPAIPSPYTGVVQYETENFDFRHIGAQLVSGAASIGGAIRNYQALGYTNFGTAANASIRYMFNVTTAGTYQLATRYSTDNIAVSNVDLYINGVRVGTPAFAATPTSSDWASVTQAVSLNAGANTVELRSTGTRPSAIYFDNIRLWQ